MSEMRSYSTEQTINATVSTQGYEDGENLKVRVRLLNTNEQELGKKETNTKVQNHKATYSFQVKTLAQELNIDIAQVVFVKCWIDADGDGTVDYNEEITARISGCYCNRDFTVDEVKMIVKQLRQSENINSNTLWNDHRCPLLDSQKSYELFTSELNKMMKKYEINTCIRKIHFLAQSYHETDRFRSTMEYTSQYTGTYDPYRGRGLLHLTLSGNYQKYQLFSGMECVNNYVIIGKNLSDATDAGGWYWRKGCDCGDLNKAADRDDVYYLNVAVNGGGNGFSQRIKYSKKLIRVMEVEKCTNLNVSKPLGIYKLSTSQLRNTNFINASQNRANMISSFDDE